MVRVISIILAVAFALATVVPATAGVHDRPASGQQHVGHTPDNQPPDNCSDDCSEGSVKLCCPVFAGGCGAGYIGASEQGQLPTDLDDAYLHQENSQLTGCIPDAELPPPRA